MKNVFKLLIVAIEHESTYIGSEELIGNIFKNLFLFTFFFLKIKINV